MSFFLTIIELVCACKKDVQLFGWNFWKSHNNYISTVSVTSEIMRTVLPTVLILGLQQSFEAVEIYVGQETSLGKIRLVAQ